ncbi:MAG: hypothetical protein C4527_05695 [Candidatus Omnitrophota bacterium]|jgi:hypothetical protein|nr:MAG: hypothetical protein C4527_05695 [Candidatus Omnitrophota bacterium]
MNQKKVYQWLGWSPLLFSLLCFCIYPIHWYFFFEILTPEDGIIEYLTAIFAFAAGFISIGLGFYYFKRKEMVTAFILFCYAAGCIFLAGEEISWGQRIFDIKVEDVSAWLAEKNRQEELNLHNIAGFAQIRLLADAFCLIWGITIPWRYQVDTFPIRWLRPFFIPSWLIPGFVTTIFITWPQKISEAIFDEIQWVCELRLGEFKELCFSLVCLLFSLHLLRSRKSTSLIE